MKKRIYLVGLILALSCAIFGCGKKKSDDDSSETQIENAAKDDILEFVNVELPAIKSNHENAIAIYNEYFESGEDKDLEKYLTSLNGTAIPAMDIYMSDLAAIEVTSSEVTELKKLLTDEATKQKEAMQCVADAITNQDSDYLVKADEAIDLARESRVQYEDKLIEYANANGITIKNEDAPTEADTGEDTTEPTE